MLSSLQWANRCLAVRNLKVRPAKPMQHDECWFSIATPSVRVSRSIQCECGHPQGLEDAIDLSVTHPTWQRTKPDDPEDEHTG